MHVELKFQPSNTVAKVQLGAGEACVTEAGAMVAMSGNLQVTTTTHKKGQGSIFQAAKRLFAGESFFLNHYQAQSEGEVWLTSTLPGDMIVGRLSAGKIVVQSGAFLCAEPSVHMNVGWQGFKSLFSGESLFWLELSGQGQYVLSSFGAIYEVDVESEYIVDTGHIVAFEETLNFSISKAGSSWVHSFLGGEGFVCKFKGRGKVWCQSHNPRSFGLSLTPLLRPRQN